MIIAGAGVASGIQLDATDRLCECLKKLLRDIARVPIPAVRVLVADDGSIHTPPDPNAFGDAGFLVPGLIP